MYKKLLTTVVALGLASSSLGCVESSSTLFIRQVPVPDSGDTCVVANEPTGTFISDGILDRMYTGNYLAWLLIGNQIAINADKDKFRADTAGVQLESVQSTVFIGGAEVGFIDQPVSGYIDPGGGTTPSYGLARAYLIDGSTTSNLITAGGEHYQAVARVKAFGRTLGGLDVETGFFDFPITICNEFYGPCTGCYATEQDQQAVSPCAAGQEPVDCKIADAVKSTYGQNPGP